MSKFKHFLLLGSLGVVLLAGLMFASHTLGSRTAFASGCNNPAQNSWSNNCQTSEGNISNYVYAIQYAVDIYAGQGHDSCAQINPDGDFGPLTDTAVKCFQKAKGLTQDGIVGPLTWGALQSTLFANGTNNGWTTYDNGDFRKSTSTGIWEVESPVNFKDCEMVDNSLGC